MTGVIVGKEWSQKTGSCSRGEPVQGEERRAHGSPVYVFRPLDREEFRRRVSDSFPSVYLTVIGIIQAVALGILAENLNLEMVFFSGSTRDFLVIFRSISLLMVLIFVFFEYGYFVGIFQWSPGYLDASIPFVLGSLEIFSAYLISNPLIWWLSMSFLFLFGTLAFCNTRRRLRSEMFANTETGKEAFQRVRQSNLYNIYYAFYFTVLFSIFTIAIYLTKNPYIMSFAHIELIFHLTFFISMFLFIRKENIFLSDIHAIFDVEFA